MSYIVKNCPCAYGIINEPMYCLWKDGVPTGKTLCQNCTDCVIKQVIDLCNASIRPNETNLYNAGRMSLAVNIVGLFDIEEINK